MLSSSQDITHSNLVRIELPGRTRTEVDRGVETDFQQDSIQ